VEKKAVPTKKKKKKELPKKEQVRQRDTEKEQSLKQVQTRIDEIKKRMAAQQKTKQEQLRTSRIVQAKRNAYLDAIASHIKANWSLLKNQMEDVGILTTDVGLQIRRDGTITKIVIEKPSGNALFDEFAVRAVKRSTPLPPFPKELKERKMEVTIGLSS
jgi:TonB family protein